MAELNGWLIALVLTALYFAILFVLYRKKLLGADRTLSLFGPALMVKTQRGRGMLERVGRHKRFWTIASDIGIGLAVVAMVTIVIVLLFDAVLATRLPASAAPTPQEALGLPGINPIIPLGYGLVALIVGVVVHELFHGIVARSQNIGVKSLGILWLVIPVGAFVEQDDEQMMAASRRRRDRVAAAGVLANFLLAVIFFVALAAVVSTSVQPNANGVGVTYVVPGTPAENASLAAGDIIVSLNGTATTTNAQLFDVLSTSHPHQVETLVFFSHSTDGLISTSVTLAPLSSYTQNPADASHAFLGVAPSFLPPAALKQNLVSPASSSFGPLIGVTDWVVLPIAGLEPVSGTTASFFHLSGPFAGSDPNTFWIGANVLYWLAWMNLLLGISNALPLYPLDGGLLFRDFAASFAHRVKRKWDEARLDGFGGNAAKISSIAVLVLLAWQFIAPRL